MTAEEWFDAHYETVDPIARACALRAYEAGQANATAEAEKRAKEREAPILEALRILYEETADYIRINHLGDVHHNRSMQVARDVLEANRLAARPASEQVGFCALCPSCGGCTQGHVHCTKCGCPKQGGQAEGKKEL